MGQHFRVQPWQRANRARGRRHGYLGQVEELMTQWGFEYQPLLVRHNYAAQPQTRYSTRCFLEGDPTTKQTLDKRRLTRYNAVMAIGPMDVDQAWISTSSRTTA